MPPKEDDERSYPLLSQFLYDHAAQIITVPAANDDKNALFGDFARQVQDWQARFILQRYPDQSVYHIHNAEHGGLVPVTDDDDDSNQQHHYYATAGMGSLPQSMVNDCNRHTTVPFEMRQDVWVSLFNGAKWMPETQQ
jgi:hypothetical protein